MTGRQSVGRWVEDGERRALSESGADSETVRKARRESDADRLRRRAGLARPRRQARANARPRARRGRRGSRIPIDPSARPCGGRRPSPARPRRVAGFASVRGLNLEGDAMRRLSAVRPAADASDESGRDRCDGVAKDTHHGDSFPEVYRRPACQARLRKEIANSRRSSTREPPIHRAPFEKEPRNRFSARLDERLIDARSAIDTADAKPPAAAHGCVAFPRGRRCGTPEQRWRGDREEVVATDIGGARVSPVRARPASASTGGDPARFASGPPRRRCRPSPAEGRRAKRRSR